MKKIVSIFLLALLLGACQQKEEAVLLSPEMMITEDVRLRGRMAGGLAYTKISETATASTELNVESTVVDKKKIIRDGNMSIRVKTVQESKLRVDSLVSIYQGYYANESFNNTEREASFNLSIRIPASQFDGFIASLEKGYGEVLYKEIQARDVTDQFIDLETRLINKRNYLERYSSLLKQAKTVKDILQIQEEIRGLEEEIESTTGRLKYLSDQVDYSTLRLNLTEQKDFQYKPDERDHFGEKFKQALSKGWFGFVDFVLFLIKIWPVWLVFFLVFIFLKRWNKSRMKA